MTSEEEGFDFLGSKIDPADITAEKNYIYKSNLNALEAWFMAASDACHADKKSINVLKCAKMLHLKYKRNVGGKERALRIQADVLSKRVEVEDRKQKVRIDADQTL